MSCPVRTYPLRKPDGHVPPIPRWQLRLPVDVGRVHTAYVGVQRHGPASLAADATVSVAKAIEAWCTAGLHRAEAVERFVVLDGDDEVGGQVFVCYWSRAASFDHAMASLDLAGLHAGCGEGRIGVGLWCERFSTAVSRLETNYSGLDYLPGLARLPGASTVAHELSAYWGAARDRIPESAHDLFGRSEDAKPPALPPRGIGQRLVGTNYDHVIHIRSGQFWQGCDVPEREAYEDRLKPTLEKGLHYLWEHAAQVGTVGLRYLVNVDPDGHPLRETCAAGFFRSLGDLERWAETHPSHLAIFHGALDHAKSYGEARRLRTWHEVSVFKQGEVGFDYINCTPRTGAIRWVVLQACNL